MEFDRNIIEKIVRQVLSEQSESSVLQFTPMQETMSEANRLNTGNSTDRVYTKDLVTLAKSPNLGFGIMEMQNTTFSWHLDYDEVDIVLEGTLSIIQNGVTKTANAQEALYIPKGSSIQFSAPHHAKFLYVTYPADWKNAAEKS